jgi:hypothetical protein
MLALLPAWLCSAEAPVAVFTETFNGYQRTRLPDHSFKAETYAFGEGGMWGLDDSGADAGKLSFSRVARAAAVPLAQANYVPTSNPNETSLLVVMFWGRTLGSKGGAHSFLASIQPGYGGANGSPRVGRSSFGDSVTRVPRPTGQTASNGEVLDVSAAAADALIEQASLDNPNFDRIDDANARIVGYGQALFQARYSPQMIRSRDVREEVAVNRYYVVLQAYDFRSAWKEKKLKLLWSARISIEEDDNDFDKSIEHMLATAAGLFGQESGGLQRRYVPKGSVTNGPLEVLDYFPSK